ncbi:sensor histidine kinase [Rhizomonospora bruguierae]|uniref:sensor histidine kinase n=1 Tax=Rhizomonospora bruguierae TaxID=1581705 RepID=UPI001BCE2FF6|nr:histidine kinase [Micromonospora sp. NBRC 107566]
MRLLMRIWRSTVLAATGPAIGLAGWIAVLTAGWIVPGAVASTVSGWYRFRYADLLDEPLAVPAPGRDLARQFAFIGLAGLLALLSFAVVVGCWAFSIAGFGWLSFGWAARDQLLTYGDPVAMSVTPIAASLLILLALALPLRFASWEIGMARALLQPSRTAELSERVDALTGSRADVVDAADAERRRIERDLHDGAQQRLVSLAMNLGLARATLADTDPRALDALTAAHEEAKLALTELRDLVRGLHPAVLDDRGLDAALSGVAARSPVPVELSVSVPERPSRTVEAVAYFVVAEALSNIAKHAGASAATVAVSAFHGRLHVVVTDDGCGGADPSRGTGLRGLAQRVGSVDGTLTVSSPEGGPTEIRVELPCES